MSDATAPAPAGLAESPLRSRGFLGLLSYRILAILSYQIVAVTVGWHVYELTHNALALGLIGLTEVIPYFCFALFAGYLVDILPSQLIFGLGLSMMVAPLTTALMRSVSGRVSGLASAINNAISRVGPQLAGALIFVVISIAFYNSLHAVAPNLDVDSPAVRTQYQPLNPAPAAADAALVAAVQGASTDAFHLAMLVAAGLLVAGAAVNGAFISNRQALTGAEAPREDAQTPGGA